MTVTAPPGQPKPMQPGDYTPAGPASVVSWQLKRLAPPSPLYIGVDDVLRVAAASSRANEVVTVSYRLLRAADATVVVGQFTVAPSSNRAVRSQDLQLAEGFLLSVSCQAAVATTRGQTFVRLLLNPKTLGAGQPAYMLMADYVTTATASGFPNGRVLSPLEGPGLIYRVTTGAPGAGNNWSIAVPANARWRVQSISALFTTSAAVANRFPAYFLSFGGTVSQAVLYSTAQTASGGITYQAYPNAAYVANFGTGFATAPIGPAVYLSGNDADQISSTVTNIDVNDNWLSIVLGVEEWLENV